MIALSKQSRAILCGMKTTMATEGNVASGSDVWHRQQRLLGNGIASAFANKRMLQRAPSCSYTGMQSTTFGAKEENGISIPRVSMLPHLESLARLFQREHAYPRAPEHRHGDAADACLAATSHPTQSLGLSGARRKRGSQLGCGRPCGRGQRAGHRRRTCSESHRSGPVVIVSEPPLCDT